MCKGRLIPGIKHALAVAVAIFLVASGTSCAAAKADPGSTADPDAGSERSTCAGPATARTLASPVPISGDAEPALPVSYTDVTGQEVTIIDASRILALDTYGTLATTVYALGLGDHLVGRDVSTGLAQLKHLPLVTHNGHELNGEAILDLDPSVVLTDYSIGPLEVQMQLRDAGIPVVIMSDQRSRDQIVPQIRAVAEVLGVPQLGVSLGRRVESDVKSAEARVAKLTMAKSDDPLRMVFLYMRGTAGVYYWFGQDSGAGDLIEALGAVDVAGETGVKGAQPLSAEGLSKANPEVILMMSDGLRSVGGVEGLTEVAGVAETDAGMTGCVIDMADDQILGFGPQFPATLAALAEAIYGGGTRK